MHYSQTEALEAFHARYAGASDRVFARGVTPDGRSSYQALADCVPPEARRVLDLACGDGPMLARLAAPGRSVVGLDRSAPELAAARARLGPDAELHEGLAQALPFEDASFDAATCHMAFMFFEQPETVVRELRRVLAPGARFAAVVGRTLRRAPFAVDFFAALGRAEAMDDLKIAWSTRHTAEEPLLALFDGWSPTTTAMELILPIPRARAAETLRLCYYDAGLLGAAATAQLEADVEALLDAHQIGDTLPWAVGMGLLQAIRPG